MGSFFVILVIVAGYFVLVSIAIARADNKRAVSEIAFIVLLIYGCGVGMFVAIGQYLGETGLLLYVIALLYSIFFLFWKICSLIKIRPRIQIGVVVTFVSYILAVLYITTFMRNAGSNHQVQMEVLNWMREDSMESFDHIFLNVAMFVPVGVIYPFITEQYHGKMFSSVSFGILFSTTIETGQLFFHSGTCDIDDILSNSLGTLIGVAAVVMVMRMKRKFEKRHGKGE